jgi:hypothetical protein
LVAYTQSVPLRAWLSDRRTAVDTLERAHREMGEVDGPGRPREIGRPVGHAYILRVVAEFQAFTRDLHDLAVARMVDLAGVDPRYAAVLTEAATAERNVDRGNPTLRNLQADFRRIGLTELRAKLSTIDTHWAAPGGRDKDAFEEIMAIRNALAHGNQAELDQLRSDGLADTVSWARSRLPR